MDAEQTKTAISMRALRDSLHGFLHWWRNELLQLMPVSLRQSLNHVEHQLVIHLTDDTVQVTDCRHGQVQEVFTVETSEYGVISPADRHRLLQMQGKRNQRVVIRLPREHVLYASFSLPLEAENNLLEVLGYEMSRHTPFKVEQVYFDYRVVERRIAEKLLWVSIVVVPRSIAEPVIDTVKGWGITPAVVTFINHTGIQDELCRLAGFNLLPLSERNKVQGTSPFATRALSLSAALLMLVAAVNPVLMQELRIRELRAQVDATRHEATEVLNLKQQLEQVVSESEFIGEKKNRLPEVLNVLEALTKILPDDTWLERFELKKMNIRIQGFSADASLLVGLLESSPLFEGVAFDSPIVKDPRNDRFHFQIVAGLSKNKETAHETQ